MRMTEGCVLTISSFTHSRGFLPFSKSKQQRWMLE